MHTFGGNFMDGLIPDLDDCTQRLKENPPDLLEEIRQEYEEFLTKLEALAVEAIATNDWNDFYAHLIKFQSQHDFHGVTGVAIEDEQIHKYKSGQLVQSIINGNVYRVEEPLPGVYKLRLIQFGDGAKVNPPAIAVTDYFPEQEQYLEVYQA